MDDKYKYTPYTDYYYNFVEHYPKYRYCITYLKHVFEHKKMVYIAWIYIADTLCSLGFINESDIDEITTLIMNHDDSKLERDEFVPYAKKFNGPRPNNPNIKFHFKRAVKIHKERNLHHYENLSSYKNKDWKHYSVELICDYIAMGWEFGDYIYEYFQRAKDKLKNDLPKEYYNYIESIINIIPEKLSLAEEPLTKNNIDYITYMFNYHNDPFEEKHFIKENKKTSYN